MAEDISRIKKSFFIGDKYPSQATMWLTFEEMRVLLGVLETIKLSEQKYFKKYSISCRLESSLKIECCLQYFESFQERFCTIIDSPHMFKNY